MIAHLNPEDDVTCANCRKEKASWITLDQFICNKCYRALMRILVTLDGKVDTFV